MLPTLFPSFFALVAFASIGELVAGEARLAFKHEAVRVQNHKRQVCLPLAGPPAAFASSTTPAPYVLAFVTPSPSATPVPITQQSQTVTSYVPLFTLCDLPSVASPGPFLSTATNGPPYKNYSASIVPSNGSCTTIYSPTPTVVCATVLQGLATQVTVSQCAQYVTFSSQYGYVLETPRPSLDATNATNPILATACPTIRTLTTYYVAPWQGLTTAGPPSEVDIKICTTFVNGTRECVLEYEVWEVRVVTLIRSTTTSFDLTTTIPGPSQLLIETFAANITETVTTLSLSTAMVVNYEFQVEETSSATRAPSGLLTGSTVYETHTLEDSSDTQTSTSTTTRYVTVYSAATSTVTMSRATSSPTL